MERFNETQEQETGEVRAMTPQEVLELKHSMMPELVFETVNALLAERITRSGHAQIKQKEILDRLEEDGLDRQEALEKHWLDIEDFYKGAGWEVSYKSPSYGDYNFESYFSFQIAQPRGIGAAAMRGY